MYQRYLWGQKRKKSTAGNWGKGWTSQHMVCVCVCTHTVLLSGALASFHHLSLHRYGDMRTRTEHTQSSEPNSHGKRKKKKHESRQDMNPNTPGCVSISPSVRESRAQQNTVSDRACNSGCRPKNLALCFWAQARPALLVKRVLVKEFSPQQSLRGTGIKHTHTHTHSLEVKHVVMRWLYTC